VREFAPISFPRAEREKIMKQACIAISVILAIIASGSAYIAVKSTQSASASNILVHQLQSDGSATKAKLDENTDAEATDEKTIAFLQGEISKLRDNLSNSTAETLAASENADDLQRELYQEQESNRLYVASVPRPGYVDGKAFFASVIGVHGGTICKDASYEMTFGSRVFFRLADGKLKGIEVDDLHPLVLHYLGVDMDAAKANQHDLNMQSAATRQRWLDQLEANAQANAIQSEANARIALASQQAAQEEADKQNALFTDRITAVAKLADAQRAPTQINNTTVNTAIQQTAIAH
jgi:hypothetical protein